MHFPSLAILLSFSSSFSFIQAQLDVQSQNPLLSNEPGASCHNACSELLTTQETETQYGTLSPDFPSKYFSTYQRTTVPACVFTPSSPEHISTALDILKKHSCHFTVRSGGHGMFSGASNAPGGVTIDLCLFDGVDFLGDVEGTGEITRVGTGAKWGSVYRTLEKEEKTVLGGRNSDVGVGGFLLGGGISFHSRRHGWGADNVKNFEVILSNGSIRSINQASAPDLYWALRGGSNNFGIVTHFDLETYPQGQLWGGYSVLFFSDIDARKERLGIKPETISLSKNFFLGKAQSLIRRTACVFGYCNLIESFIQAGVDFAQSEPDSSAQMMQALFYYQAAGAFMGYLQVSYTEPVANPPAFNAFKALKPVYSSNKISNMWSQTDEVATQSPYGLHQLYRTATIRPNAALNSYAFDLFIQEIELIKDVEELIPSMVFQPLHKDALQKAAKDGGNCLGLDDEEESLFVYLLTIAWSNAEDNDRVNAAAEKIFDKTVAKAKEMGLLHRFVYQNYADITQDVFAGYGEKNREKLREVQKRWDPQGVFKGLVSGYFKV